MNTRLNSKSALSCLLLGLGLQLSACHSQTGAEAPSALDSREAAQHSRDPERLSQWLASELVAMDGSAEQAVLARARLDEVGVQGLRAELLRGIDDLIHGRPRRGAEEFLRVVQAARKSEDPDAELYAWYAAQQVFDLASHDEEFGAKHSTELDELLKNPGKIGFRAYATLVDFWATRASRSAQKDLDGVSARLLGCVSDLRVAGPFGQGIDADVFRAFAPEEFGAWPVRFSPEPGQTEPPRVLDLESSGCDHGPSQAVEGGVFYAETYLELGQTEELIVTASGSLAVWVDDHQVLTRNLREFGSWPKFGVHLELGPGRHRVLWKLGDAHTNLRVMRADGTALPARAQARGGVYSKRAPRLLSDPNVLLHYLPGGDRAQSQSELTRYIAAYLSNLEGQPDLAAVVAEPLLQDHKRASALLLLTAGMFTEGDPIYEVSQTRDLVHELNQLASEKDAKLWYPRLQLAIWEAQQKGPIDAVDPLAKLADEFPEVSDVNFMLARLYEELDWGPEFDESVRKLLKKFPDHPDALSFAMDLAENNGDRAELDRLLKHLVQVSPDSEIPLARALAARDYQAAKDELRRLSERRPERKDLLTRLSDLLIRSGDREEALRQLELAVEHDPKDVQARLALADYDVFSGKPGALASALVAAVVAGGDPTTLEEAIDLVEGMTALEPYRLDARKVISEYESRGAHQAGTAARILDYGALLLRSDGTSRFLEHEVVRVQSEEGILQFTEMNAGGLVLHLRVLKQDGRVLEPEMVAGKPTVTMPHLEIGDYIELERIVSSWGDGRGLSYVGPTWFFREENIAYARSEFVVVSPKGKELQLETTGKVPAPELLKAGPFEVRRYRMDDTPAAPSEPNSPPANEFLPSVSVGWGVQFEDRLRRLGPSFISTTALDPRIVKVAQNIVKGAGPSQKAQAQALYHWVLDSVQEGQEEDGRRVVVGRNGNRWRAFEVLCRSLGIQVRWAVAESRLSSPPRGELSEAQKSLFPLMQVTTDGKSEFLSIEDKFAPYGSLPGHLRGETAYLLGDYQVQSLKVPTSGQPDGLRFEGKGSIGLDGTAKLSLSMFFDGKFGASFRNGISQIPENQLEGILESRLLGKHLEGAKLLSFKVVNADQLDEALRLDFETEVPNFATKMGGDYLLTPPFMPKLSSWATLSERQTPLLVTEESDQNVDLELELPLGFGVGTQARQGAHAGSSYSVLDEVTPGNASTPAKLRIRRLVHTGSGRISPDAYGNFQAFTRDADSALYQLLRISRAER